MSIAQDISFLILNCGTGYRQHRLRELELPLVPAPLPPLPLCRPGRHRRVGRRRRPGQAPLRRCPRRRPRPRLLEPRLVSRQVPHQRHERQQGCILNNLDQHNGASEKSGCRIQTQRVNTKLTIAAKPPDSWHFRSKRLRRTLQSPVYT